MSPEGKFLRSQSGSFVLFGLLAGDIAFNVWYLISRRKREREWERAVSDIRRPSAEDLAKMTDQELIDGASTHRE